MSKAFSRPISLTAIAPLDVTLSCAVLAVVIIILAQSFSIWMTKARGIEPIFLVNQARYALAEEYAVIGDIHAIRDTTDHVVAPGRHEQMFTNVGATEIVTLQPRFASESGSSTFPFRFAVSPGDVPWSTTMACGRQPLLEGWSAEQATPTTAPTNELSFACRGAVSR